MIIYQCVALGKLNHSLTLKTDLTIKVYTLLWEKLLHNENTETISNHNSVMRILYQQNRKFKYI